MFALLCENAGDAEAANSQRLRKAGAPSLVFLGEKEREKEKGGRKGGGRKEDRG